jgi:hypothetical protein
MSRVASFHLATFPARRLVTRMISVPAERWEVSQAPGCVLGKVLGTSRAGTTRTSADLRRWAIFAVWESNTARSVFVRESPVLRRWRSAASSLQSWDLEPVRSKGLWGGVNPFPDLPEVTDVTAPVAVLTRASVRPQRWWPFMRSAGRVDDALQQAAGCDLALGIGEWPVGEQATFSLWNSADDIDGFAYNNEVHSDVVRRTFAGRWYSEMLFTRFRVTSRL